MNAELFEEWFKHHFLVHAPSARPLLLLLDGHASHYTPRVLRIAAEEDIIFLPATPYHTSPPAPRQQLVLIPKEGGMPAILCTKSGKVLNRRNVMGVFQKAWVQGMTISNVISCFHATGVCISIDRRVSLSQLSQQTSSIPTHSASTPYVPFCTP